MSIFIDINQTKFDHYYLNAGDVCKNCGQPIRPDPLFPMVLIHVWNGGFKWCNMSDDSETKAEWIPYGEVVANA